jgi:SAM-dependent methyltransferase
MLDLFGTAILDFQTNNSPEDLVTETNITEPDIMRVAHLFRVFEKMPIVEQKALQLAKGKILDVGCGAGSHSLYLQNIDNLQVTSIDISPAAIKACKLRGIKNAVVQDIMLLENQKFDTILVLMNGTGICGTLNNFAPFLQKLKSLLHPNGQILTDSTDILYMYDDEEQQYIKNSPQYYGEVEFTISYKNKIEEPFNWLYLDYKTLENIVLGNNLQVEKIIDCENHSFLVRIY